ncbi:MAG: ABC transporter ATP-binding protein, partial [Firmicutes bacterium]|nr:ABC transporter ATP-binding protein [Bacillota bacterium]
LLGENGAGKTTLMNMLSGIYTPDEGEILINGEPVTFHSPGDSIRLGIGMIHQHFKLVNVMSAKDNIVIGQKTGFFTKGKELSRKVKELSDRYGLDIDPDKKVYEMSVGEKQTLEIIKVLYRGANILILDEPTAVLTPQEIKKLFKVIRNMKEQGCAVVIITHKLNEVMEISDRVTVLRKGQSIGTVVTKDVNIPNLIEMMVGKKVELSIEKKKYAEKTPILTVDGLTVKNDEGKDMLSDVTFELNTHEILGVAGVANSGQKELCESIAGLVKIDKGRIFFNDENIVGKTPRDIIKLGIRMGFIPEDRLGMGLVAGMDIVHNMILKDYQNQPGIFLRRGPCIEQAQRIVEFLDIMTPSIYTPVKRLSGGNIQKVLLGREIDSAPKVLITAYAVRGLDIGASYKIYDLLNEQKAKGVGVLFVGEDLDVLMDLCDRVIVLCHGEIIGIVDPDEVTKEDIGLLMTGQKLEEKGGEA